MKVHRRVICMIQRAKNDRSVQRALPVYDNAYFRTGTDRNGRKQIPKGHLELLVQFRMTESDARWGGRSGARGGMRQATARQCMAGQGLVGWGREGYMFS